MPKKPSRNLKKKADAQREAIDIEAFMKQVVSAEKGEPDDAVPPRPDDLEGNVDYTIETWLQHRIHHTYPEPGGYNDQDDRLMRDWKRLNLWHLRVSAGYTLYDDIDLMPAPPNVLNLMHD